MGKFARAIAITALLFVTLGVGGSGGSTRIAGTGGAGGSGGITRIISTGGTRASGGTGGTRASGGIQNTGGTKGTGGTTMSEPTYVYAITYVKGVLDEVQYLYITRDGSQALKYSEEVYPGSVVVKMEQVTGE